MLDTLTVSQYNTYIKQIFEAEELLHNIKIIGEVFGMSRAKSAVYFSLKDSGGMVSCVSFYPGEFVSVQDGDKVTITGSPNYYAKGGRLSFNVSKVEKSGQGDLFIQFLAMKDKLEKEGLFDQAHKKPIPSAIKTIGVISSKEGAVIHDIVSVCERRDPSVNIAIFPVKVQGNGAETEIANAIKKLSNFDQIDVIVVARGGGSLEDLAAFNTEIVARATYECEKPIVSAVGHETDFTIIDFVSDLRAPTPSAAAEILTKNKKEQYLQSQRLISMFKSELARYFTAKHSIFEKSALSLSSLSESLLNSKAYELGIVENSLQNLDPAAILKRGYAKVEQAGKTLDKAKNVVLNCNLEILFSDGSVIAEAKTLHEKKEVKNEV